jgi:hypothetical protein
MRLRPECQSTSGRPDVIVGWDDARSHICSTARVADGLRFSERGSAAASSLVTIVGLDIGKAVPGDLDKLDCRFICMHCLNMSTGEIQRGLALTWRECVRAGSLSHMIT